MPNYNQAHQFYAGVDLHARSMFVHVLSARPSPNAICPSRARPRKAVWCRSVLLSAIPRCEPPRCCVTQSPDARGLETNNATRR